MCIFTSPVAAVSDTRIFARMAGAGRQYLAYEMSFAALGETAMVLPLPVASRDESTALRFIDLSATPDFFDRIAKFVTMYEERRQRDPGDDTLSAGSETVRLPLKVHEVGAFEASFVPSIAEFDRLDARFRLSPAVWEGLPQYRDYGFAVFKLAATGAGARHAHPMAFEFSTRESDRLYIPTVHVHDGSVPSRAWFDHVVFAQVERWKFGRIACFENGILAEGEALEAAAMRWENLRDVGDWRLRRGAGGASDFGIVLSANTRMSRSTAAEQRVLGVWRRSQPGTRANLLRLSEYADAFARECPEISRAAWRAAAPTPEEQASFPGIGRWMQIAPEIGLEAGTVRCWQALGAEDRALALRGKPAVAGDAAARAWLDLDSGQREIFGRLSRWDKLPPLLESETARILGWMEQHLAPRYAAARRSLAGTRLPLFERAPEALMRCVEAPEQLRAPEIRDAVLALNAGLASEDVRSWRELEWEPYQGLERIAWLEEIYPLFDAAQEIHAVGLSGMLPNRDTLIDIA